MPERSFDDVAREALGAFWMEVARHYPEIRWGDFDPLDAATFQRQAETAVALWYATNDRNGGLDAAFEEDFEVCPDCDEIIEEVIGGPCASCPTCGRDLSEVKRG
jgi:hypothetical protein